MTPFELQAGTRLKLTKTTPRKEEHGKDRVQAISLRLEWSPPENGALNVIEPGLQDMIFWTPPEVAAQCALEGMPPVKKHLRCETLTQPLKFGGSLSGYTFTIEHGIDDSSALELYSCTLDKFEVEAKQGGSSTIRFSLASNKQITPELIGALCSLDGGSIVAQLTPPTAEQLIDGSTEAFKKDHPDATDLFTAGAGTPGPDDDGDDVPPDGADEGSEGGPVEHAEQPTDPERGEHWPFGSEGETTGHSDATGDADAFEAGAARAIREAGVRPKRAPAKPRGRGQASAGAVE